MKLRDYLGTWRYTHGSADKWFRVIPQEGTDRYQITWGNSPEQLNNTERKTVVEAQEAFRRLRNKARGGFTLVEAYTGTLPKTADLVVADLFPKKQTTSTQPVEKKEKFSFLNWVAGK